MTAMTRSRNDSGGYAALLADGGFQAVLWTQFLAAFNDNVYKMIVSVTAVDIAVNQDFDRPHVSGEVPGIAVGVGQFRRADIEIVLRRVRPFVAKPLLELKE